MTEILVQLNKINLTVEHSLNLSQLFDVLLNNFKAFRIIEKELNFIKAHLEGRL